MIDRLITGMVEGIMEFEELDSKDCKAVFVSGKRTLEIWYNNKLTHFRIFSKDTFNEFSFPTNKKDLIIKALQKG